MIVFSIKFNNKDITKLSVDERAKLYIGDILKREYPFVSKWRLLEATQEDEYSVYYLVPAED